jgi:branched-chain amino acid transport system substrate-binding protein
MHHAADRKRTLWRAAIGLAAGGLISAHAWAGTVTIGVNVPLTGVQAGVGKEAEAVWRAFAKHANDKNLARGHTFQVTVLDDGFDAAKTKANAEQLIQQGAAVIVATAGIPQVQAMLPVLETAKTPLLAPGSGSLALRGKSPAVFHIKASFGAEVDRVAALVTTMGVKKVAVVIDDAPDRKALVERLTAAVGKLSGGASAIVQTGVVAQQGGKPQEAVATALAAQPDAVYVMTIPGLAGGVLKELRAKGFRGHLMTWSVAAVDAVARELGSDGAGIIFSTVTPSPTSELPGIKANFRTFAREQGIKPSYRAMEIYIAGRVLAEALGRVGSGPVNGAKVWASLEGLRDASIDGWRITYSPTDREGSVFVDTMMLRADGKFQ